MQDDSQPDNFFSQLIILLPTVINDNLSNYSLTQLHYKSPCVIISNRVATQMIVTWAIICIGFLCRKVNRPPVQGYF